VDEAIDAFLGDFALTDEAAREDFASFFRDFQRSDPEDR